MGICVSKQKRAISPIVKQTKRKFQRQSALTTTSELSPILEVSFSESVNRSEVNLLEPQKRALHVVLSNESFPSRDPVAVAVEAAEAASSLLECAAHVENSYTDSADEITPKASQSFTCKAKQPESDPFSDFESERPISPKNESPFSCTVPSFHSVQSRFPVVTDAETINLRFDEIESQVDMLKYMHDRLRQDSSREFTQQRNDLDALMEVVHELCERDIIEMDLQGSERSVR